MQNAKVKGPELPGRYNDSVSQILISAGEASGDRYASWLLEAVRKRAPETTFFGCAGEELRAAGCEAVVRAETLSTVGLREVLGDIPRIYGEFRKMMAAAERRHPNLAVLVDSPDFNLRLAGRLRRLGVPVLYLVAPQAWAWRPWRARQIARLVKRLLCIFPFEEKWFCERGVNAEYIGHPLAGRVRPSQSRGEFLARWNLREDVPLVALLPGSRRREIALNLPRMIEAARQIRAQCYLVSAQSAQDAAASSNGSSKTPPRSVVRDLPERRRDTERTLYELHRREASTVRRRFGGGHGPPRS